MAHSECGGRRSLRSSCRTRSTTHPRRGTYMRSIRHTYDRCQHATQHAAVRVATQCASCVPMQRARYKQVAIPNGDAACTDGAQNMTAWELHARNRLFDQPTNASEANAVRCKQPHSATCRSVHVVSFGSNRNCSGDLTSTSDGPAEQPCTGTSGTSGTSGTPSGGVEPTYLYSSETPTQNSSAAIQWMTTTKKTITCRREH